MNGFFHRLFDRFHHGARDDYEMIEIGTWHSSSDTDSGNCILSSILSRIANSHTLNDDDIPCELHVFKVPHVDTSHLPSFVVVHEMLGTIRCPRSCVAGCFDNNRFGEGHFPYFLFEGNPHVENVTRARLDAVRKLIVGGLIDKALLNFTERFGFNGRLRDRDVKVAQVGDGHGDAWEEFLTTVKEGRINLHLHMLPVSEEQPESVDRAQDDSEDGKNRDYDFHSRIHNGFCHKDSRSSGAEGTTPEFPKTL